jgi:hypothetical protein
VKHLDLFSGIGGFALAANRVANHNSPMSYTKFNPDEMEVERNGDDLYCPHTQISTNGFGTRGVCIKCGAFIVGKELSPSANGTAKE